MQHFLREDTAAAAAKSLQSCPTLCDPIDGSSPGSPVPGILQARTLEWVAISFSNAWKWKVKVKSLSRVRLFLTPWTAAHQAPPSMGFSRQEYWSGVPLPSPREDTVGPKRGTSLQKETQGEREREGRKRGTRTFPIAIHIEAQSRNSSISQMWKIEISMKSPWEGVMRRGGEGREECVRACVCVCVCMCVCFWRHVTVEIKLMEILCFKILRKLFSNLWWNFSQWTLDICEKSLQGIVLVWCMMLFNHYPFIREQASSLLWKAWIIVSFWEMVRSWWAGGPGWSPKCYSFKG